MSGNHKEIMLDPASPDLEEEGEPSCKASQSIKELASPPKNIYALFTTRTTNTDFEKEPSLDRQFDTYAVYKQMLARRSKILQDIKKKEMARYQIRRRESPERKLAYPHFEISGKYHILPTPSALAELRKQGREANNTTISMNSAVLQGQILENTN